MADDLVKVLEGQSGLSSVCVSPDGVYIGNRNSGEVRRMSPDGELELVSSMGSVGGLVWREGQLLGADAAQQRVFRICGGAPSDLVTEVQGTALVGPNDVAVGPDGTIFFSDGGALGESPLANPRGSLYAVNVRGQTVTPVASSSLAQPSGVAVSSDGASLYLCETAQNRVLRYIQRPAGVWHGSVFFQFAGLFGPTCIDVDEHGNLYVGRCDLAEGAATSTVTILRSTGEEYASFTIPGAELSGLSIDNASGSMYLAETSKGTLYQYKLPKQ